MKVFSLKKMVLLVLLIASVACDNGSNSKSTETGGLSLQSWNQYKEHAIKLDDGRLLAEGDLLFPDEESLKKYYVSLNKVKLTKSTVHLVNSVRDIWDDTEKRNISYCISDDFGSYKERVVAVMNEAVKAWEECSDVNFIYRDDLDWFAEPWNNDVVFNVRPATWSEENQLPGVVASSFVPSLARADRELIIFYDAFLPEVNIYYTFKHELGHALGLRHEHIWDGYSSPGDPTFNAEIINRFDNRSIMYYNYLPGYRGNNNLSIFDKQGVSMLYGGPYLHLEREITESNFSNDVYTSPDGPLDVDEVPVCGKLESAGAYDWYSFYVPQTGGVQIILEGITDDYVTAHLFQSNGSGLITSIDSDTKKTVELTRGTYYLRLSGYDGIEYSIAVAAPYELEVNNSIDTPNRYSIVPGSGMHGEVDKSGNRQDWYRFYVSSSRTVRISLTGKTSYYVTAYVYNANESKILTVDSDEFATFQASRGYYYIMVSGYAGVRYKVTVE